MLPAPRISAESSARRQHGFRGSMAASSARTSSESTFELQEPALVLEPERSVRAEAVCGHHAVTWHEEREAVPGAERPRCPLGIGVARQRSELAVRDGLAVRDRPKCIRYARLERCGPGEVEVHVVERDWLAREIRPHALDDRMPRRADGFSSSGQLVIHDPPVIEPELPHTPPFDLVLHHFHGNTMPVDERSSDLSPSAAA